MVREESVYFVHLSIVLANKAIIALLYIGVHSILTSSIRNSSVWNIGIDDRISEIQECCYSSVSVFMILIVFWRKEECWHLYTASSVSLVIKHIEISFFPCVFPFFFAGLVFPIVLFCPTQVIIILTRFLIYENGRVCLMVHYSRLTVLVHYFGTINSPNSGIPFNFRTS